MAIYVVGQDFAYPDGSNGDRLPGVFVLANRSDSVTDSSSAIIRYKIYSRTLGMRNEVTNQILCQSHSHGFCSNIQKTGYDFSYHPNSPSPTGGSCKRFDITVVTKPFDIYQTMAGDYSSSFYLVADEAP